MGVKVKEKIRGSGEWWLFIDHNGKRKAKKVGRDKRTAMKAAKEIEARLALGDFGLDEQKDKSPTLSEYVKGWRDENGKQQLGWFDKVALLSLKNSTHCGYRMIIDGHLLPAFGSIEITKITSRMISDLVSKKVQDGMKSSTVRNLKNCLSAIFRHAVNPDGLITVNTARGVPIPKREDERATKEADPCTWDERAIIEDVFLNNYPRFYPLVLCGFRTGLRIGELLALQWQDLDIHHKVLLVQRNITRGKLTTPKTKSSKRLVRMTSQLVETLGRHKKNVQEEKLKRGWRDMPEWVFVNEDGTPLNYGNFVHRVWNRAMDKTKLRRRTPHDMRHTYATLRLSKGDSLSEVSKEMGHGSTDITYRTYYKWLPSESRSNIDELDGYADATGRNPGATKIVRGMQENG